MVRGGFVAAVGLLYCVVMTDLVERVAILLWERMAGMEYTIHGWESMSAEFQEEWREHARAVVELLRCVMVDERVYWPSPICITCVSDPSHVKEHADYGEPWIPLSFEVPVEPYLYNEWCPKAEDES